MFYYRTLSDWFSPPRMGTCTTQWHASFPAAYFACILLLFFAQHPFEVNPISPPPAPPVPSLHPEGANGYAVAQEKDLKNGQGRSIRSAKKHKKVTFIPPNPVYLSQISILCSLSFPKLFIPLFLRNNSLLLRSSLSINNPQSKIKNLFPPIRFFFDTRIDGFNTSNILSIRNCLLI